MASAWFDFLICFFFGVFGVHRFRAGQVGWGLVYFFTFGLFGFGWFIDAIRFFFTALSGQRIVHIYGLVHFVTVPVAYGSYTAQGSYGTYATHGAYAQPMGQPQQYPGAAEFVLSAGERLVYRGPAAFVSTDSAGNYYASDGSQTLFPGTLAVTTRRIIFTGAKGTLDRALRDLTSVTAVPDGVLLQYSNRTYPFQTSEGPAISQAVAQAVNARY